MAKVTRGQAVFNLLQSLAELCYTVDGGGFVRNGMVPDTDGKFLRLSERSKRDAGKMSARGGQKKSKRREEKSKESARELLGRISMELYD